MKRYELQHIESRRRVVVDALSFHDACHAVGWLPTNVVLLRAVPLDVEAEPSRHEQKTSTAPAQRRRS
ncbi:MAG: hypothetical protein KatS3mg017_0845 [Fimbriimonadales bacterium]|nr:MAG: hypothetical protein KatS3mg018_0444 [Fimbriimonadales bacterium]GIV07643.1 MAG: hypothetical protein KatS3mg017_0845 [Fimbriimonadales bacterium]GIV10188.1 MAG: hypothetical protein KatS3mg019_2279 [Fimbriimonadales bacterium]GIV12931.1 MAG: hypothetical protein KatS3mg021_1213 [Fimbriimonadales bacterium]